MIVRVGGTVLLSLLGLGLAGMMYEGYVRDLFLKTPRDLSELISTGADPIQFLDPETMDPYSGPVFLTEIGSLSTPQLKMSGTLEQGFWHGPWENYDEYGELIMQGTRNMGVACGVWIEAGLERTYESCPPGVETDWSHIEPE